MQRSLHICGNRAVALDHHGLRNRRPAREAECRGDGTLVHLPIPREARILLVKSQQPACRAAVLQRALHQSRRDDGVTVVGESRCSEAGELDHLRELLSTKPLGDRGHESGGNGRVLARLLDEGAEHGGRIDHRVGVRHRQDRAVATGCGRRGARRDRLLVLTARHAEVHVRVDERRCEDKAGCGLPCGLEGGDHALLDGDIECAVDPCRGVDHARAA